MEVIEGVVVALYKKSGDTIRFCVLRRQEGWEGWELVKGHRDEEDGSPAEAARREVEEETGITLVSVNDMRMKHSWTYERDGTSYKADYDVFLAEAPMGSAIDVSANHEEEHSKGYFLNYRDARDILKFDNQKTLLDKAVELIEEQEQ